MKRDLISETDRDRIVDRIVEAAVAVAEEGRVSYEWFAEQIRGQLEIGPDINYCLSALKRRGIKLYDATRKSKQRT